MKEIETLLKEIEDKAKAATKGPWKRDPYDSPRMQVIAVGNEVIAFHGFHPRQDNEQVVLNFEHIARMDPGTSLALVAEIRRLRRVADAAMTFFVEREKGEYCGCLTEHYNDLHDALRAMCGLEDEI